MGSPTQPDRKNRGFEEKRQARPSRWHLLKPKAPLHMLSISSQPYLDHLSATSHNDDFDVVSITPSAGRVRVRVRVTPGLSSEICFWIF